PDTAAAHQHPTPPDPRCDTYVFPALLRRRTDTPQTATRSTRPAANTHTPRAGTPPRPQSPPPTPAPATYNSPTTPAGTGRNQPSSTNNAAPDTGAPIGGTPDPAVKGALIATITVVSVGP